MEKGFKSQLLFIPFTNILKYLSTYAKNAGSVAKKCAISYTWPITTQEQGLQERVLRLADDLKSAGVNVYLDLTHYEALSLPKANDDPISHTESTILAWLCESEAVLLIGSPSYTKRAADFTTLTHRESAILSTKRNVIPLLLAGDFPDAFPPGYTGTLGASIVTLGQYFQNFPEVVATLLRIDHYPEVGEALRKYRANTEEILLRADRVHEAESAKLFSQIALQHKAWAAKVLICRSHFTPDQQLILDGKITECERKITEYCVSVAKEFEKSEVPIDTTEGATRSLEDRLEDFLHSEEEKVLLLQAPPGAHKSHASKFLAYSAWYERDWVPVVVDLKKIPNIDDQCVANALKLHQFDDATIAHAQATRKFLLLVEGFDKRNCQVNVYIRCSLKNWKGKAVFTCRSSYVGNSAQGPYYFMPADLHQRPQPTALKIISFTTVHAASQPAEENTANPSEVHKALLIEAAVHKPNRAKENWRKVRDATFSKNVLSSLNKKSLISRYTNEQRTQLRKGFSILQQDTVRPMFVEFLAALSKLKVTPKKAFISYAWPVDKSDCAALQMRLLTLVQDMALAGVTVLLDILYLHVGVDITKFMKEGIETSDSIFWIGTPRLVQRIWFNNGKAANPATIEFCHIRDKIQNFPQALRPLHFLGKTIAESFPTLDVASPPVPPTLDFRNEKHYFETLPQLAASVLGVDELPEYKRLYHEFCAQMRATEATFTVSSIMQRLDDAAKQLEQEEAKKEDQLQQLLGKIPDALRSELAGTKEAQVKALHSLLAQIQATALSNATADLDLYIPLKGGVHVDSPPQLYFDVGERVVKFLTEKAEKRVMLIQGGAGAGKTLFGRFLERYLWQNLAEGFIPIFVSLPKASDPYSDLLTQVLHDLGLGELDPTHLATEKFVFILDGLDELPLEKMPSDGILICNNMLALPNAHFILTSRNHYVAALEVKFGVPVHEHLTQHLSLVEDVFMMPFDTAQIQRYLAEYCRTPEAAWDDWKSFWDHIETIPGLSTLAQTPFMLKLLTISLPRLVVRADMTRQIKNVDVYQAFSEMWFEREMWKQLVQHNGIPPNENRVAGYLAIAKLLSQTMFAKGVTTISATKFRLQSTDMPLLSGLPIIQQQGNISFIHKSVQEFFTAYGWVEALPTTNLAQTLLGARLASTEAGLLKFVAQMYNYKIHHVPLTDLVLASRGSAEGVSQVAAANAMTILNSVKFSFSGMDLSGTNIQGAILDSAIMHKTNFSHANLTDVSLRQAWLDGADLSHASLLRAWFDHRSEVLLPDKCSKVAATPDGFVAVTVKSYICEHNGRTSHISTSTEVMSVATQGYLVGMGTSTGNIILWNLQASSPVFPPVNRHSGIVQCIALTGSYIVSGGYDCSICICGRERGEVLNVLKGHKRRVNAITVQEQIIISGSADGTIRFWDLEEGTQLREIVTKVPIQCMVCSDGMLIIGTEHGPIQVWNQATGSFMSKLEGHTKGVKCITYVEGKIISGSSDATVRVWDMATHREAEVMHMSHPVASLLIRVGKLVIGCEDTAVQVWDMSVKPQLELEAREREFSEVKRCFVAHAKLFLVGATAVQIVDVLTQNVEEFSAHSKSAKHLVAYESDVITWGGEFLRWNPVTREVQGKIQTGTLDVRFVEVFGDNLIIGGYEGLSTLDIITGKIRTIIDRPVLAMSLDSTTKIAAFYAETAVELLDLVTEKIEGSLQVEDGLLFLKCHQGKLLVPPPFDNEVPVWDLRSQKQVGALCGHTSSVQQLDVCDGRVATSDGLCVRMWDLSSCRCVCAMDLFVLEPTKSIALAGKWLATISKGTANAIKWWKPDETRGALFLLGVMPGGWPLTMRGCNGEGVTGISKKQRDLFKYLGATV